MTSSRAVDFLLIHGAWHGAWCWDKVAELLRDAGHGATVPCLPGVGERAGELSPEVDLSAHSAAVAEAVEEHRGGPLVAVAHSYAGAVLLAAGERVKRRLAGRVFLDASVLEDGERVMDLVPPAVAARRIADAEAAAGSGVAVMAPPPGTAFGLVDLDQVAHVEARLTPHPLATYLERMPIPGPPGAGPDTTYVVCTDPEYAPLASSRRRARSYGWHLAELASGHDAMISAPEALAELLADLPVDA